MQLDPQLIQACIREDRNAQSALYRQCYGLLMGVCLRYHQNREDATAILNQGFLKILRSLDRKKEQVPWEAWMRRIMINTIIDDFRKHRKHQESIQYTDWTEPMAEEPVAMNSAALELEAEALEHMIQTLSPMTRQVFNLYAIDGYAHKEIAETLEISVGTSKWHVSNARKQLQAMIQHRLKEREEIAL